MIRNKDSITSRLDGHSLIANAGYVNTIIDQAVPISPIL